MVNKNLLLGKLVSNGYNQLTMARALRKSKNTFNAKVNNRRPFDTDEILEMCDLLKITSDCEKAQIFLSNPSQNRDDSSRTNVT